MTALWTAMQLAEALGVPVAPDISVTGISIDTRTLQPGELFIPLKGENFDGHDYAKKALENGAAAVLVERALAGMHAQKQIQVKDNFTALQELATFRRAAGKATCIGVTGSVGKTSVKEALYTLLSAQGETHATIGNLNNHIGLPLTLARMPLDTRYAILEMGMNHAGEIAELTKMAKPDVCIITAVEAVHMEFFANLEAIADAKAEIFLGQKHDTITLLPRESSMYPRLKNAAEKADLNIVTFGRNERCDYQLMKTSPLENGQEVMVRIHGKTFHFQLGLKGEHQAINMLGVLGAIHEIGGDMEKAMQGMAQLIPASGRGQMEAITINGMPVTLINDSYNASPVSMKAAFAVLAQHASMSKVRSIAVLGDMRELGANAPSYHAELAESLQQNGVDGVLACGEYMTHLYEKLPRKMQLGYAPDALALLPLLEGAIQANDILLIKGSHGSHMYKLADRLLADN